jgi:hypothetical protein
MIVKNILSIKITIWIMSRELHAKKAKKRKKEKKKIDLNKKKKVSLKICISGSKFNSKIYE